MTGQTAEKLALRRSGIAAIDLAHKPSVLPLRYLLPSRSTAARAICNTRVFIFWL